MAASRMLRLVPSESALLVCDMQDKFRNHIQYFPQIVEVTRRMIEAANLLDIKIVATEQNPNGLGHTVTELGLQKHNVPVFTKTKFSMCSPDLRNEFGTGIKSVLICGIEAHVCVYHTAIDFQEKGFNVHVLVDGSSSRSMVDRIYAYKQLERAGINLSTSECVILGLVGDSVHEKFKAVQRLIKESAPDTGLLANISLV
uniref:Isochorismatase domain-containing protein 1 n=3 Tax=Meloidogyne TaxID=189290 RepID=A0A915MB61_MELJA